MTIYPAVAIHGAAYPELDKGKKDRGNGGDRGADTRHIVEQKGQETPENGKIHAEDGQPYPHQDPRGQTDERLDDHIAFNISDEPRELGKDLLEDDRERRGA